jgi:prepilin peptidase CpaA
MVNYEAWMLAAPLAAIAGGTDYGWRRIPNWLTVPGLLLGIAASSMAGGWAGAKSSLLGAALGLALLLPFVLVRSLGAGDWKLVGALGAFLGPQRLLSVLFVSVLVAGVMAVILIVWKRRVGQTIRNLWRMLGAFATFHMPDSELSLDNPHAAKVPFGLAVAIATIAFTVPQLWGSL